VRRGRAEDSMWEARAQARRLRRELDALQAAVAEEQALASARPDAPTGHPADLPPGTDTDQWEIDPVSGLLRSRHLPVVLQQVVASARRKVQPVSVVVWELDGLDGIDRDTSDPALTALGAVAWRTLRESDSVFRLGDVTAVGVLMDTAEPGAVMVAERVRDALRASPIGDSLTVSAGIACYPTHALDAAELVARAGRALEQARDEGHERDHVAVAEQSA
jgi:diguanylate cyclase (GGDEF)-like protein